jgi:hypothetical protein
VTGSRGVDAGHLLSSNSPRQDSQRKGLRQRLGRKAVLIQFDVDPAPVDRAVTQRDVPRIWHIAIIDRQDAPAPSIPTDAPAIVCELGEFASGGGFLLRDGGHLEVSDKIIRHRSGTTESEHHRQALSDVDSPCAGHRSAWSALCHLTDALDVWGSNPSGLIAR